MPGERCPDFLLPADDGLRDTFHARHAGRPSALLFAADAAALAPFAALAATHALLGVLPGAHGTAVDAAIPALGDPGGLAARLGLPATPPAAVAWVLDGTLRLRRRLDAPTADDLAQALAAAAAAPAPQRVVRGPVAPVLMVPEVLDPGLCRRLIAAHAADHVPSGTIRLQDGRPTLVPDARAKRRLDHRLVDPALVDAVTQALARRVLPEIASAFHYPVTRLEGFKLAAYDAAEGGCFRPHRDNLAPDARHRRFALTLALDDDFEGGGLRFPEYGADLYRPPPGGALVFSGSLLHEVTDVTRGRRHVLLSFLWGDDAGR